MIDDNTTLGRVTRVETGLQALTTEFGGIKVQIENQGRDLQGIASALGNLDDKLDKSRPGIGAIWTPLGVLFGALSLIGGAIAVPQLARVERLEFVVHERGDKIEQLRIDTAILKHDAERAERSR